MGGEPQDDSFRNNSKLRFFVHSPHGCLPHWATLFLLPFLLFIDAHSPLSKAIRFRCIIKTKTIFIFKRKTTIDKET